MPFEIIFIYAEDGDKYILKSMSPTLEKQMKLLFGNTRIVYNTTMWMNGKCRSSSWNSNCPIYFFEKNNLTGHKKIEIMIFPKGEHNTPVLIQVRRIPRKWLPSYDVTEIKKPLY